MPAMGEQVIKLLQARGADAKARIAAAAATPEGQKIIADLQDVTDAIDVLMTDVKAGLEAALAQGRPPG